LTNRIAEEQEKMLDILGETRMIWRDSHHSVPSMLAVLFGSFFPKISKKSVTDYNCK
jgi:hypothetical protein